MNMIIYSSENFHQEFTKLSLEEMLQLKELLKSQQNQDDTRDSENSHEFSDKIQKLFHTLSQLNTNELEEVKEKEKTRSLKLQEELEEKKKLMKKQEKKLNTLKKDYLDHQN